MEDTSKENPSKEVDAAIKSLKNQIVDEREKILSIKCKYTEKLDEKNEIEKLIRACINDLKEELWDIKTELRYTQVKDPTEVEKRFKENIKEIIDKEKKLTLLYDKMFHIKAVPAKAVDN